MENVRVRVAVYVIRNAPDGHELLVFDHRDQPEAGTQVPAGGVDEGESIEEAVYREVREETGISDLILHSSLGVQQRPHPHTGQPRVTIFYHASTKTEMSRWSRQIEEGTGDDRGMIFDCYFIRLSESVGLLPDRQDEFVSKLMERLTVPAGRLGE
jgi:ADP-ribose pyrophosphatase YjhB (NUDIX family)